MNQPRRQATHAIAMVLRWGAYLSAAVLALGLAWVMGTPERPLQIGPPIPLRLLVGELASGNPYALIQVGLLLLLLTPLARVLAAAVSFGRAGERGYALVSLVVLGLILLSLLGLR